MSPPSSGVGANLPSGRALPEYASFCLAKHDWHYQQGQQCHPPAWALSFVQCRCQAGQFVLVLLSIIGILRRATVAGRSRLCRATTPDRTDGANAAKGNLLSELSPGPPLLFDHFTSKLAKLESEAGFTFCPNSFELSDIRRRPKRMRR